VRVREILDETLQLLESGQDFALVKLAADRGSTPRAAGAEMLVRRDGSIAGTIGGGLLELTMMTAAREVLEERRSRVTDMGLAGTDVASEDKMICGGSAEVLITYVQPGDPALLEVCRAARAAQAAQRRAWLFTILPAAEDAGGGGDALERDASEAVAVQYCLVGDDDSVAGARTCETGVLRATVGKTAVHGSTKLPDGRAVLVERLEPAATVIICGGGHVGQALAPAALAAGFRVVVIDDRGEFANPQRFPGATVVLAPFAGALARVGATDHAYVVIVTRGHVHDIDVLAQALRTPARYVGLMASRGKRARIWSALKEAGFGEDDFARVRSPIGLEIGAETPAELAVSIVAQLIQVRAAAAT
jgi:xanthine dehydrogenase accessory factor